MELRSLNLYVIADRFMVLFETPTFFMSCPSSTSTLSPRGKISKFDKLCCCDKNLNEMSTIGHAAFAVCKVKENREKSLQKFQNLDEKKPFNIDYNMEYNPVKYNSKLMNSIWGMYNRYSVHNLKKIMDDVPSVAANQQTSVGNAATLDRNAGSTKTGTRPAKNLMQNWFSPNDYSY